VAHAEREVPVRAPDTPGVTSLAAEAGASAGGSAAYGGHIRGSKQIAQIEQNPPVGVANAAAAAASSGNRSVKAPEVNHGAGKKATGAAKPVLGLEKTWHPKGHNGSSDEDQRTDNCESYGGDANNAVLSYEGGLRGSEGSEPVDTKGNNYMDESAHRDGGEDEDEDEDEYGGVLLLSQTETATQLEEVAIAARQDKSRLRSIPRALRDLMPHNLPPASVAREIQGRVVRKAQANATAGGHGSSPNVAIASAHAVDAPGETRPGTGQEVGAGVNAQPMASSGLYRVLQRIV